MPLYEYKCSCGKMTEEIFGADRKPKSIKCICGKRARRHFGAPAHVSNRYPGWLKGARTVLSADEQRSQRYNGSGWNRHEYDRIKRERGIGTFGGGDAVDEIGGKVRP
jgi:hypothetical protein